MYAHNYTPGRENVSWALWRTWRDPDYTAIIAIFTGSMIHDNSL